MEDRIYLKRELCSSIETRVVTPSYGFPCSSKGKHNNIWTRTCVCCIPSENHSHLRQMKNLHWDFFFFPAIQLTQARGDKRESYTSGQLLGKTHKNVETDCKQLVNHFFTWWPVMTAEGKMFGTISRVIIVCTRNSTVFISILYLTFVSECFPPILLRMDLRLR